MRLNLIRDTENFIFTRDNKLIPITDEGRKKLAEFDRVNKNIDVIAQMTEEERLQRVIDIILGNRGYDNILRPELRKRLVELRQNLPILVGMAIVFQLAQTFPLTALIADLIAYALVGMEGFKIAQDIDLGVALAMTAATDDDFIQAANVLAHGISQLMVDTGLIAGQWAAGKVGDNLLKVKESGTPPVVMRPGQKPPGPAFACPPGPQDNGFGGGGRHARYREPPPPP